MLLPHDHETYVQIFQKAVAPLAEGLEFTIQLERPKSIEHGDIACNVAMQLAKKLQKVPRAFAESIVAAIQSDPNNHPWIERIEVAGPGFINVHMPLTVKHAVVQTILQQQEQFGLRSALNQKVLVEFVSANPTGPLHVGHARQAALGDAICRLFTACGWQVTKEFYYNDAGNQIDNLALSVQARAKGIEPEDPSFPADGYRGQYILEIAQDYLAKKTVQARGSAPVTATGNVEDIEAIRQFAVTYLRNEQDLDLRAFDLEFDNYYLESSLYTDGRVEQVVDQLQKSGYTYEQDGALWLRTTDLSYHDDKDRVMRKKEGGYTYFVPDVAYHVAKWERGFTKAINIQGSDHHGTVARVRSGLEALNIGIPKGYPDYILHKMVKVIRDGAEVKISKRAGSYVTLRDLIDWVGKDVVRYFLVSRKSDTEFIFDVDLARKKSDENPVFYIQYAHARICSILNQAKVSHEQLQSADRSLLIAPKELLLIQRLAEFPSVVYNAAQDLSPHQVAFWLKDCAADFHAFYNDCRILVEDNMALQNARLALLRATKQVIANGLDLLGVSCPEQL